MKALPWIVIGVGTGMVLAYIAMNQPAPQAEGGWDSVENAADRTWKWGTKSRVSGTGTNLAGKLKEGFGRATGDQDLASEGVVDQAVGSVKDVAGTLAHAASDTIHDLNR